jgi:hypothetical protein
MRYFKYRWVWAPGDDGEGEWGDSWWYTEFGPKDTITRQIMLYDNGFRLRYGPENYGDEYGELLWDVSLHECETPPGTEISREELEAVWETGPWTNDPPAQGKARPPRDGS